MDLPEGVRLSGPPSCSVCLEDVSEAGDRSIAKLACGHLFHLDCIGSAFNAKGFMQCPNCRHIENGQWLYNCGRECEETILENPTGEGEYGLFAEVQELLGSDEQVSGHIQWCPYLGYFAQFSSEAGSADDQHISYPDSVDVLVGENLEGSEISHPCPVVLAQNPDLMIRVADAEDDVQVQQSEPHPLQEAWHQRQHPYLRGHSGFHHPAAFTPISEGVAVGSSQDRSMWPHLENVSTVHPAPRYYGRRQQIPSAYSVDNHQGRQFSSVIQHYPGQSTTLNPSRVPELGGNLPFTQRRQEGASAFQQYPPVREGRWGEPAPTSGLYRERGIFGSELPTQAQFQAPAPCTHIETVLGFHSIQHYLDVEEAELELYRYQSR